MGGKITDVDVFVATYRVTGDTARSVYVETLERQAGGYYIPKRHLLGPASTPAKNNKARRDFITRLVATGKKAEGISNHNLAGLTKSLFRYHFEPGQPVTSYNALALNILRNPNAVYCIALADPEEDPAETLRWQVLTTAEMQGLLSRPIHGEAIRLSIRDGFVRYGVVKKRKTR